LAAPLFQSTTPPPESINDDLNWRSGEPLSSSTESYSHETETDRENDQEIDRQNDWKNMSALSSPLEMSRGIIMWPGSSPRDRSSWIRLNSKRSQMFRQTATTSALLTPIIEDASNTVTEESLKVQNRSSNSSKSDSFKKEKSHKTDHSLHMPDSNPTTIDQIEIESQDTNESNLSLEPPEIFIPTHRNTNFGQDDSVQTGSSLFGVFLTAFIVLFGVFVWILIYNRRLDIDYYNRIGTYQCVDKDAFQDSSENELFRRQ
jgi:hypothetical protein